MTVALLIIRTAGLVPTGLLDRRGAVAARAARRSGDLVLVTGAGVAIVVLSVGVRLVGFGGVVCGDGVAGAGTVPSLATSITCKLHRRFGSHGSGGLVHELRWRVLHGVNRRHLLLRLGRKRRSRFLCGAPFIWRR